MRTLFFCGIALVLVAVPPARAHLGRPTQANMAEYRNRRIPAVHIATPPVIDGDLSDAAWASAAKADTFIDRQRGTFAADQTTAYICYDDRAIYVAFRCTDSQPAAIVARETIRDSRYSNWRGPSEDSVEVVFDFFNSHRWDDLTRFSVNAIGTPSARLGGGRAGKMEWKGEWEGAARRTSFGWTAEMRIPWNILNYPPSQKPESFGINFYRYQERTKTETCWSDTGPQEFLEYEGLWTGVHVPASAFRPALSLLPYILSTEQDGRLGTRFGLDARYPVTPELTVVGSVNPDFATVEGAVEGIAFSRSERFVPERRPFFLEGRDYVTMGQEYELGPFFYSRRIEAFDVGAKVYGKITPKDTLGVLDTMRFGRRNDLVLKLRHDFGVTSAASAFLVQKSSFDNHNTTGVLNHNIRWGKFSIGSLLAGTAGPGAGGSAQMVTWSYEDVRGFTALSYVYVSPDFADSDGLIFFTDRRGLNAFHEWGSEWRKGFWRSFHLFLDPHYEWHADGRPFRRGGSINFGLETRSDWAFNVHWGHDMFDDQTDSSWGMGVGSGVSNRFRQWGIGFDTGKRADEPYTFVGPGASFRIFRKLDLGYSGAFESFEGGRQQHIITVNYEVSPTRSFGGRIVTQQADTNWYISYRSAGGLGTEIYVMIGDPNAARFTRRLTLKLVLAL